MLGGDRFFDNFAHAEGGIARRVEISGRGMQSSFSTLPGLNFMQLNKKRLTCLCLSTSEMLMMWPKEGITLILMLLSQLTVTRLLG